MKVKAPRVTELSGCSGSGGQRPTVSWTEHMKGGARSSLFAALFFPDSKRHPSSALLTDRHFESPADRSRNSNPQSYVL